MRENWLRWFRHVNKRSTNVLVRICDYETKSQNKNNGRKPKKTWKETLRKNIQQLELTENLRKTERISIQKFIHLTTLTLKLHKDSHFCKNCLTSHVMWVPCSCTRLSRWSEVSLYKWHHKTHCWLDHGRRGSLTHSPPSDSVQLVPPKLSLLPPFPFFSTGFQSLYHTPTDSSAGKDIFHFSNFQVSLYSKIPTLI